MATANVVSAIRLSQLEPLGLRARTAAYRSYTSNNTLMKQFAIPNSFAVGSLKLERPPFYLFPDDGTASTTGADIGWMGMDLLWGSDFELDFANNKLSFYSTKHCSAGAVYWTEKYSSAPLTRTVLGNLIILVEVEGKRVEAVISTSSPRTAIRRDAAERLYGFDGTSHDMALAGAVLGNQKMRVAIFTEKVPASCELTSRRTGAFYYLGDACKGIEAPLLLGLDVLRHLHLYVATQEQVVYFSDADASK